MRLRKDIALSESGFIFNPATGDAFTVNAIGLAILELLKEGASLDEVKKKLNKIYQVEEDQLNEDLYDFSSHLNQLNLLENESG